MNGHEEFVWVFEISGAVPPAHLTGGYAGRSASASRRCISAWAAAASRASASRARSSGAGSSWTDGKLKMDIWAGAKSIELPQEETERRWQITTPQWPIMHAVLYGVTRDQMMARHKANHIQVAYAPDAAAANLALAAKAAMFREMGLEVAVCGTDHGL